MAAAQTAVQRLAAASNVRLAATAASGDTSQNQFNPILIVAIALTVGALTLGARFLTRRRARPS
jgi:hypothetical protein